MKNLKFSYLFNIIMIALVSCIAVTLGAQSANPAELIDDIKGVSSWTDLVTLEAAIYTAVITLGGYLSAFIPVLKNIDSGTWRVLVWAVMVIAGSVVLGFGNVWMGAIAYFFSTSLYEILLKKLFPSPKPTH